jgi:hypothetical protein
MLDPKMRVVRSLVDSLRAIQRDIHAKYDQANAKSDQEPLPTPIDIRSEIRLPPPVAEYYASERRDRPGNTRRDRIRLALEAVALAAAIGAAIFTFQTLGQVRRQANAAQDQLSNSVESFRIDERAWLEIEPPAPRLKAPASATYGGALFTYDFYLKNVGKTAAFDIAVKAPRGAIDSGLSLGDDPAQLDRLRAKLDHGFFGTKLTPNDDSHSSL